MFLPVILSGMVAVTTAFLICVPPLALLTVPFLMVVAADSRAFFNSRALFSMAAIPVFVFVLGSPLGGAAAGGRAKLSFFSVC